MSVDENSGAGQQDQFLCLTPIERQIQYALIIDHLPHGRILGFDKGSIGLDFDLFGNLAHCQNRINDRAAVDLQHNACLNIRSKARQCRFEPIRTQRQVRQYVGPCLISNNGAFGACVGLRYRDFDARQYSAALVFHATVDLSRGLRPQSGRGETNEDNCNENF